MAPCMDNWLDLSDGDQVKAHAGIVLSLTDPVISNATSLCRLRFMPVTRDMSAGERTRLDNFLAAPAVPNRSLPQPQPLHALARLSRSIAKCKRSW